MKERRIRDFDGSELKGLVLSDLILIREGFPFLGFGSAHALLL